MKMKDINIGSYLSDLSIEVGDMTLLEELHESTKYFPSTMHKDTPRIVEYLTSKRAILETSQNVKHFVYAEKIQLPKPQRFDASLNHCLQNRRTASLFNGSKVDLQLLSNVLGASMAPTKKVIVDQQTELSMSLRPYASGGGLYPVEVYPILLDEKEGHALVTHYNPIEHELSVIHCVDRQQMLNQLNDMEDRLGQSSVVFMFTAVMPRVTVKYGTRGHRFALLEAGLITQNLSLCSAGNGLSTLPWGGFYDDAIADLMDIDNVEEIILHCMALGHEKQEQ
jgi:SagB-type dehydrogenase family enzyme